MESMNPVQQKQAIAIDIARQTQVLKTCPVHRHLYFDDEVNPVGAFALAIDLVRKHNACVEIFDNDEHELTDLLSETLRTAPQCCPECQRAASLSSMPNRSSYGESVLEVR